LYFLFFVFIKVPTFKDIVASPLIILGLLLVSRSRAKEEQEESMKSMREVELLTMERFQIQHNDDEDHEQ
jgi:hypothetical protein